MNKRERKDIGVMTLLPYHDSLDDIEQPIHKSRLVKVKYELRNAYICDIPVSSKAKSNANYTKRTALRKKMETKSFTYNSIYQKRNHPITSKDMKSVPKSCLELLRNPRNGKTNLSVCELLNKYVRRRSEHNFIRNSQPMRLIENKNYNSHRRYFDTKNLKKYATRSDTGLMEEFVRNQLRPKSNGHSELQRRLNREISKVLNETNIITHNNIEKSLPLIEGTKRHIFSNNVLKRKIIISNDITDNKENVPIGRVLEKEEKMFDDNLCTKYQ